MTYRGNGRFSGRGENSATLAVDPLLRLIHDRTIDYAVLGPESIDECYLVVPCHSVASADWTRVYLTVRENSRDRGFNFILDEPVTEPRAIIGWNQEADRPFLLCTLWRLYAARRRLLSGPTVCGRNDPALAGKRRDDAPSAR